MNIGCRHSTQDTPDSRVSTVGPKHTQLGPKQVHREAATGSKTNRIRLDWLSFFFSFRFFFFFLTEGDASIRCHRRHFKCWRVCRTRFSKALKSFFGCIPCELIPCLSFSHKSVDCVYLQNRTTFAIHQWQSKGKYVPANKKKKDLRFSSVSVIPNPRAIPFILPAGKLDAMIS